MCSFGDVPKDSFGAWLYPWQHVGRLQRVRLEKMDTLNKKSDKIGSVDIDCINPPRPPPPSLFGQKINASIGTLVMNK